MAVVSEVTLSLIVLITSAFRCKPFFSAGFGFEGFFLAVSWFRRSDQRIEQLCDRGRDINDSFFEGSFVYAGGPGGTANLADELKGGEADLLGGRGFIIEEGFYVSAHASLDLRVS